MLRRRFGSNERVDAIVSARGKPKRARETDGHPPDGESEPSS